MTSVIPRIIHFSVPEIPSAAQLIAVEMAKKLHPAWEVKIWADPYLAKNATIRRYLPLAKSGAQRADLVRLDCILSDGGFYLDSDLILHQPLDSLQVFGPKLIIASEDGDSLTNAFFGAPPGHGAVAALVDFLDRNNPSWDAPPNETTGPALFSRLLRYRRDVYILPRDAFYPYRWDEPRPVDFPLGVMGIHEWASSWKSNALGVGLKSGGVTPNTPRRKRGASIRRLARALGKLTHPYGRRQLGEKLAGAAPVGPIFYCAGDIITAKHPTGVFLSLDASDHSLTPHIALKGVFEPLEESFVSDIVQGGDWFVDIGANIGLFSTIAAAQCGPFGRVFAIEPNEAARRHIERSASINWFSDRIEVLPFACSDKSTMKTLVGSRDRLGEYRLGSAYERGPFDVYSSLKTGGVEVEVRALDELFPCDLPIKCLKMDIEGHEDAAIRGGERLLRSGCVAYLMIEYGTEAWGSGFCRLSAVLAMLEDWGYAPFRLAWDDRGAVVCTPWPYYASEVPRSGHVTIVLKQTRRWLGPS